MAQSLQRRGELNTDCTDAMTTRIVVPLYRVPARVRVLRDRQPIETEPLALEDFSSDEPIADRDEQPHEAPATVEVPPSEPTFTIEQVQQEVQAAYERGFAEGQEVASAILETELRTTTERVRNLSDAIVHLQTQYAEAIARSEAIALDLAVTIARAILGYEAEHSAECILAQARSALEQYHGKDAVTIRLHPDSLRLLQEVGNPITAEHSSQSIAFVADSSVEPGGCILETALGTFDAQLSTQLARARQLLERHQSRSHSDEVSDAD